MILLENLIMYLRKSRSDDISMSVEDVLAKHEHILQEYCEREFGFQRIGYSARLFPVRPSPTDLS